MKHRGIGEGMMRPAAIVPSLHAPAVAWTVGSMVAILVTVGFVAAVVGAWSHRGSADGARRGAGPEQP
jgi:hypothetical protein